jgi:hypothetical protein
MKTFIDREKLRRRATVSHVASLGGILILLGSTAISIWKPEWSTLTAVMLFVGFASATAGIYYANRWVKKPRPEDTLDQALKGLSGKYCLYHTDPAGPSLPAQETAQARAQPEARRAS